MVLFIYGASGAGIEIYDLAQRINEIDHKYSKIFMIDDFKEECEFYGTQRVHFDSCEHYAGNEDKEFIIAVGEPRVRKLLYDRVLEKGYRFTKLIDPRAIVSPTAHIGDGCIINADAIVSSNVKIENNCMIMFQAIVGHDANVNSNCVVCPKATVGGNSIVGENSFLGLGSSMKQRVNIGKNAIVGMGSMVFKDVEDESTVVGNPARVTKGNSQHSVF